MKNDKPKQPRYIVKITEGGAVTYLQSMVVDVFPGETWPPRSINSFNDNRNTALRFYRKKIALKAAKMVSFECNCGACKLLASVERI